MSKNKQSLGVWNGKEQAPQTHTHRPPEGETQTTEGNTPETLPERPSIAPPCLHEIEGNPEPTDHEQATQDEPESEKTDLSTHQTHEDGRPTEPTSDSQTTAEWQADTPMFYHKIGGTTYKVAVHFDRQSKQTFKDKMERLLTHQLEENE